MPIKMQRSPHAPKIRVSEREPPKIRQLGSVRSKLKKADGGNGAND